MDKHYNYANTEIYNNTSIKQIKIHGQELKTTPGSYDIFSELLDNPNKLYSKKEIDRKILKLRFTDDESLYRGSRTLYTLISQLKLGLKNIKGVGTDLSSILVTKKGQGYYLKG